MGFTERTGALLIAVGTAADRPTGHLAIEQVSNCAGKLLDRGVGLKFAGGNAQTQELLHRGKILCQFVDANIRDAGIHHIFA